MKNKEQFNPEVGIPSSEDKAQQEIRNECRQEFIDNIGFWLADETLDLRRTLTLHAELLTTQIL